MRTTRPLTTLEQTPAHEQTTAPELPWRHR